MALETYNQKRNFAQTREPKGKLEKGQHNRFVVQEHHASRLHFDFRLEMGGVLKSWAVPKGPSFNPQDKRLAVMTEDHPVQYLQFEGHIAEGNYGAGDMRVWDTGQYEVTDGSDPVQDVNKGRLRFRLMGEKLHGEWSLVKLGRGDNQWLLIKARDEFADPTWQLETVLPIEEKYLPKATRSKTPHQVVTDQVTDKTPKATRHKSTGAKVAGKPIPVAKAFAAKKLEGDVVVKVDKHEVTLTHLDKIYWPDEGYTKGDLLKYYFEIADTILPYLRGRPLILKRYPNGIQGHSFFQHDVEDPPDFMETIALEVERQPVRYALCNNLATLLYIVNLGSIAQNPWHSRVDDLHHPNWIVFDLDPEGQNFSLVCQVALAIKEVLDGLSLESYPKLSGSSGLHVYVPIKTEYSYDEVARFAELVAKIVNQAQPDLVTLERSLRKREKGEVYLDHLQNAEGKTIVSPYSVRAKDKATVAAPLTWQEVEKCPRLEDFTMANMPQRIKKKGDLFQPVLHNCQTLDDAIEQAEKLWKEVRPKKSKSVSR
ncbi:MAG: non-homologous end-joining DNA ligase [Abitibacteriaceae bacterium]|nr:non-homologous end-joining DNA ligase [Abditibacteriaceae bacterium]